MGNNTAGGDGNPTRPGYALLIAASPARGALANAEEVLPALAAVTPPALLGTTTGSIVQLPAPTSPHTVLAALRTAATHDGPLLIVVVGQLLLDRHGTPHLALARSTPRTVRYDGLPWPWLAGELRTRPTGTTTVLADLVADTAAWEQRGTLAHTLADVPLFGTLAPAPPRRRTARPRYAQGLAALLRTAAVRPPLEELHRQVLDHADIRHTQRHVFTPAGSGTRPNGTELAADPHAVIRDAARAGRHREAAALAAEREQTALRAGGPHTAEVAHWLEVQADLAWLAGEPDRAAAGWIRVAHARLAAGRATDDPDLVRAVDQAHHCWQRVGNTHLALRLGTELERLRRTVPGSRPGALAALHRHLAALRTRA